MPMTPYARPSLQQQDEAHRIFAALLNDLGIDVRTLELRHRHGAWQIALDCALDGERCRIGLELEGGTFAAVDRDPALREALLIELDEHLAECERWTGDVPPPRARTAATCTRQTHCGLS